MAIAAAAGIAIVPSFGAPPRAGAAGSCGGSVHAAGVVSTRWAMLCLINRFRVRHGLNPLRENVLLTRAAQLYALQMTQRRFFGHTSPSGSTTVTRLRSAGYMGRSRFWEVGENLGSATPGHAPPRYVFGAWTRSAPHRAVLLRSEFRDVGVGVIFRQPSGRSGVTYVVEFGVRAASRPGE